MIAFIDTETTGLIPREGHLLEVALVITDDVLNEAAYIEVVVQPVGVTLGHVVADMDPFVRDMHTANKLLEDVQTRGRRRHEAEAMLVDFVKETFVRWKAKGLALDVELDKCEFCGKKREAHDEFDTAISTTPIGVLRICEVGLPGWGNQRPSFKPKTVSALSQTPLAGSTVGFDRAWLKEHMPELEKLFSYRSIDVSSITELAKRWAPAVYEGRLKASAAHRAMVDIRESIDYLKYYREAGFIVGTRGA